MNEVVGEGWADRVAVEYDALVEKIGKLTAFLESDDKQIDPVTQMMLQSQLGAMMAYAGALWLRLRTKVQVIPEAANEAGPADPAV